MASEIENRASFAHIRYAQCWEDADVLLAGLKLGPGARVLSIASAGDNSFSLLSTGAAEVVALDLSAAQLSCVALRRAGYEVLEHGEFLGLLGSRPCQNRPALYQRCREVMEPEHRAFWDARPQAIADGAGTAGKFESYFRLFKDKALPWVHGRRQILELLESRPTRAEREDFYEKRWNTWRWRALFRVFFSRLVMGRLGRSPEFFKYVEGSVAERILQRTRHALVELEPAQNPYLRWILTGGHGAALPHALREENFAAIRANLGALTCRQVSVEAYLDEHPHEQFDGWNLSDIFEYMSDETTQAMLKRMAGQTSPGGRAVYWNMLVPRQAGASLADQWQSLEAEAAELFARDKAFFYSALRIESKK